MNPVFSIHAADVRNTCHRVPAAADLAFKSLNITPSIEVNRYGLLIASADVDQETFDTAFFLYYEALENPDDESPDVSELDDLASVCNCGECGADYDSATAQLHDMAMSALTRGVSLSDVIREVEAELKDRRAKMTADYPICGRMCLGYETVLDRVRDIEHHIWTVSELVDSANNGSMLKHTVIKTIADRLS